jgi:Tol biopolymer transport system component
MTPEQTVLMPIEDKGGTKAQLIQKGIFDPSWHPMGTEIVYTKADSTGKRSIFVCDATGQGERRVSPEGGSFRRPLFSPQSK